MSDGKSGKLDPHFRHIRHRKKRQFLNALVQTGGNVKRAAELAGVDRSTPYTSQWREDVEFQKALETARRMAADQLESEAIRRAFEGVRVPVGWHKGKPGAFVTQYSDTLLIFLLKGAMPEKYADRHELKGQFAHIDFAKLPDEALSRIANGEHPTSVLAGLAARYTPESHQVPEGAETPPGQAGRVGCGDDWTGARIE